MGCKSSTKLGAKFGTYDIETRNLRKIEVINEQTVSTPYMEVVMISIYIKNLCNLGKTTSKDVVKTFALQDYNDETELIEAFFKFIETYVQDPKNFVQECGLSLYAHNASQFDMVFLLKHLIKICNNPEKELNFLCRENKFLAIS